MQADENAAEPAATPAGLGQDATFCPQCPGWYELAKIRAISPAGEQKQWSDVLLRVASNGSIHWWSRSPRQKLSQRERATIAGKSFSPVCPHEHRLPNTVDEASVVGVIGNVNSSKSHFLTGLAYEMVHEQPLRHLDMDVAYLGDEAREMDIRINKVYSQGELLNNTEPGVIDGPFSYRLTTESRSQSPTRRVLSFFDVAGEDCIGLTKSADFVRYLFNATGIVLLIDPGGLPRRDRPLAAKGNVQLTTRAVIDGLADAMEAVTGRPSREQRQSIVVTLAKADTAELPDEIWPPKVWNEDEFGIAAVTATKKRLKEHSANCRSTLVTMGARGIIEAAETRFDKRHVFYSAVSATSEDPYDGKWLSPQPTGCCLPLALILAFGEH